MMVCATAVWDWTQSASGFNPTRLASKFAPGRPEVAAADTASQRGQTGSVGDRRNASQLQGREGAEANSSTSDGGSGQSKQSGSKQSGKETSPPQQPALSLSSSRSRRGDGSLPPSFRDWIQDHGPRSSAAEVPAVHDPELSTATQHEGRRPAIASKWPYPDQVIDRLGPLSSIAGFAAWEDQVRAGLLELHEVESLADPRAGDILTRLQHLTEEGIARANRLDDGTDQTSAVRATYALQRRLGIWHPVHKLSLEPVTQLSLGDRDASGLAGAVRAAHTHLDRLTQPDAWREYLLLDRLSEIAGASIPISFQERVTLAETFLRRLESADSTSEQQEFFAHPDWRRLAHEVRQWISEPIDYTALLDNVERVENGRGEDAARDLARQYQRLRWSNHPLINELGEQLNTHYRNANVRIAISDQLLNRLLPRQPTVNEGVNDRLLGGRILGRSRVSTQLRLVLLPDRNRWRLGLEAHGNVDSQTHTNRGLARFHNAARARYLARKLLLIDRHGVRTRNATADATSDTDLTRVETKLDGVPLVNLLARTIAKQMYSLQENDAKQEAEGLLVRRAESRLDQEVNHTLDAATTRFRKEIWHPLQELELCPEAVDMRTTRDHLIARYRLAGITQMAAFTPRPESPPDSLLGIQVHESMLNNTISSLNLGGREAKLRDLFAEVAHKLQRDEYQIPADVPQDVTLELAANNPISLRFRDGRIHVTIRIVKLVGGEGHRWNNFQVRGIYMPDLEGIHVGVQRESYVRLKGDRYRLPMRDQVALRGIFARVLPQHPDVDLLANVVAEDQRLHDLRVNRFAIHDGWIAVALDAGKPVKMHIADDTQPRRSR